MSSDVRKSEKKLMADYESSREAGDNKGVLTAHKALQKLYTHGAEPCPRCGVHPHGIHPGPGRFVVGCIGCTTAEDRVEAAGETIEDAVENWNEGVYVPPKV